MKFGQTESEQENSKYVLSSPDVPPPVRKWKRFRIDIRVKIWRWEERDDAAVVTRSHVMSEGGLSVYAPESLEIGTHVRVEFILPGSSRGLQLRAMVRNRRGFRLGMEFIDLAAADRLLIQHYLKTFAAVTT